MSKRFTDTAKWSDPWFSELTPIDKLFWIYLTDNCDHAGIWKVNLRLLRFYIPDYEVNLDRFAGRIVALSDEKWFLPKFVSFQYGALNQNVPAHRSVISILEKEMTSKGLAKGYLTLQDKDKDKDKVKDKDVTPLFDFDALWSKYPRKLGKDDARGHFKAQVKTETDYLRIDRALNNFLKKTRSEGTEDKFIPHGSTWFNKRWRDWADYVEGGANGAANSTGVSKYAALARAAREAEGLRKVSTPRALSDGLRDMPVVQNQTRPANGSGNRNNGDPVGSVAKNGSLPKSAANANT